MVLTIKFSEMTSGGDLPNNSSTPGLLGGSNVLFNNPWTFLASGPTGSRPPPSTAINYRLRFNTSLLAYEYYDAFLGIWVELSGSGTGTVNPGSTNDLAFYPAIGTTISPISAAANSVLVTNGGSVPSLSTTLPTGLSIPGATISSSTAALLSGSVVAAPVSGTDLTNKTYVDGLFSSGVTSLTGTMNQVTVNGGIGPVTGAVLLALPQDIATGSSPTFSTITLSSTNVHGVLVGEASSSAIHSIIPSSTSGVPLISQGASADPAYGTAVVAGGGTGVTSVTTSPTATAFAGWDANKNLSANSFIEGFRTTATAAGTTTLSVGDTEIQEFTGTTTQTVVLPVTSTLVAGQSYFIINNSTGVVTVNSSGGNLVQSMAANTSLIVTCVLNSGTTAASWNGTYVVDSGGGVSPGTANQLAYYQTTGNVVSGLTSANSAILRTDSSGVPGWSGTMTNGQLIIGSTGSTPTAATLSAGTGISITNGAASITISATGAGMAWTTVSGTSQAAAVNNGYITNNAGAVTVTLPATAAIGDEVAVEGLGAGGWVLTANTGQTIKIGSSTTSSAGSLTASSAATDNVYVTCIVANTTWRVRSTNSAGLTIS